MDKVLSFVGLCIKAGRCVSGEASCENAIKSKTAKLLIIAKDASENTRKKITDSCTCYQIPEITLGTKEELGRITGRAETAQIAVNDEGFASAILKKIDL